MHLSGMQTSACTSPHVVDFIRLLRNLHASKEDLRLRRPRTTSTTSRAALPSSDHVDHGPRRPRPERLRRAPTTSTTRPRRNDDRREERRYDNRDHRHDDMLESSRTRQLHRYKASRSWGYCVSTTCDRQLAYSWGYSFSFRPCYKAHTSPSSKLGDYIDTMHLPVHLVSPVRRLDSQLNWEFFLDPGTTCLRHLLPGSGTKWAHFTLR